IFMKLRARTILVEQGQCQWTAGGKQRENVLRVDEIGKKEQSQSRAQGCALHIFAANCFLSSGRSSIGMDRVRCTGRNTGSAIDAAIRQHVELGGGFTTEVHPPSDGCSLLGTRPHKAGLECRESVIT